MVETIAAVRVYSDAKNLVKVNADTLSEAFDVVRTSFPGARVILVSSKSFPIAIEPKESDA